ncbi:MAG: plastocyanin/azurin family copper-binding protein [Hyphomicrobiales bacterium]
MTLNRSIVRLATFAGASILTAAIACASPGAAGHKHDDKGHQHHGGGHMDHDNMPGGKPGDARKATRTILILAKDTEFNLKSIQVKAGETVKFIIRNKGQLVHEFTIGDPAMQKMHQEEMQKMMDEGKLMADKVAAGVEHAHPNTALVEPGQEKEVIWEFAKDETLEFGCNIPGHAEAGMKGKVQFIN